MIYADGGGSVAWREDRELRYNLRDMKDTDFYRQYPELSPFDNGKGFWTASLNRDVEMQEFVEYGRQILQSKSKTASGESEAFRAAADKLLKILIGRGDSFARYYLSEVLDREVASPLLAMGIGAQQFYLPYFTPFSGSYLWDGSRRFISDVRDAVNCNAYNRVSFDGKTKLTVVRGDSEWFSYQDERSHGGEVRGGACCLVKTTVYDISQITDHEALMEQSLRIYYILPEDKKHDYFYKFPWDRILWREAASDLAIGLIGMQRPDPDALWHATILNEYLAIRAECNGYCEPISAQFPDPLLTETLRPIFLPPSQSPPNRY